MAGEELTPNQRLDNFEKLILMHHNDIEALKKHKTKTDDFLSELNKKSNDLNKSVDEFTEAIKSGGGGSGGGEGISLKDAENLLKQIITRNEDVKEHISQIAMQASTFYENKKAVTDHLDNVSSKKKKSKGKILFILVSAIVVAAIFSFYFFKMQTMEYKIFAGQTFYDAKNNSPLNFEVDYIIHGKKSNNKILFEIEDKLYYIPLNE